MSNRDTPPKETQRNAGGMKAREARGNTVRNVRREEKNERHSGQNRDTGKKK